jgi:hypothetical protein
VDDDDDEHKLDDDMAFTMFTPPSKSLNSNRSNHSDDGNGDREISVVSRSRMPSICRIISVTGESEKANKQIQDNDVSMLRGQLDVHTLLSARRKSNGNNFFFPVMRMDHLEIDSNNQNSNIPDDTSSQSMLSPLVAAISASVHNTPAFRPLHSEGVLLQTPKILQPMKTSGITPVPILDLAGLNNGASTQQNGNERVTPLRTSLAIDTKTTSSDLVSPGKMVISPFALNLISPSRGSFSNSIDFANTPSHLLTTEKLHGITPPQLTPNRSENASPDEASADFREEDEPIDIESTQEGFVDGVLDMHWDKNHHGDVNSLNNPTDVH